MGQLLVRPGRLPRCGRKARRRPTEPTTAAATSPDSLLPPVGSRLRDALASGRFAVTAELTPPRGTDLTRLKKGAALLHDYVDAANLTDNPSAVVRLASWAA